MSESPPAGAAQTPKHLWIVGTVTLLWNVMGAFDYVLTETRNESYMGAFTPEQLEFFYGFPTWVVAFWAIAVWGGLLGSGLLLLRKSLAFPVFVASFVSMSITAIRNYGLSNAFDVLGVGGLIFSVLIFLVALGLVFYAKAMRERGVLDG